MSSHVIGATVFGLEAFPMRVEVTRAEGTGPAVSTTDRPDAIVNKSQERVVAALRNSGFEVLPAHYTIHREPSDLGRADSSLDLALAVAWLGAAGYLRNADLSDFLIAGELALDGTVRPVRGVLAIAALARKMNLKNLILPSTGGQEAALIESVNVYAVHSLSQVVNWLNAGAPPEPLRLDRERLLTEPSPPAVDFKDIKGQQGAKRALEIVAAGGHNLLLIGPPGSGKTLLARRLPTILPPMTWEEALETATIHSVAGSPAVLLDLIRARPFRAVHHTISYAGLTGGGSVPRPGEVSLAHNGVLFLDELPEFPRHVLEVLRPPLEGGTITIARAMRTLTFPARFWLAAAMNPCPCGYFGSPLRECSCSPLEIQRYLAKISGPLMNHIDIQVDVPVVSYKELATAEWGEPSAAIAQRVTEARRRQSERLRGTGMVCNAEMTPAGVRKYCKIDAASQRLLENAITRLGLYARAYHRILKIARTISDLEGRPSIESAHIAEAILYRRLDRPVWA